MRVDLIPVIEIPIREIAASERPEPGAAAGEWQTYRTRALQLDGYEPYEPVLRGSRFYRVDQFRSRADVRRLVLAHLGGDDPGQRISVADSCALFGGYVLVVDGEPVSVPQCCGTLADFSSWQKLLHESFTHGFINTEGHPCPEVTRFADELQFSFDDQYETFQPPATACAIRRDLLREAVARCQLELSAFGAQLDALSAELQHTEVANVLIYERA